jgi:hypothetical protein
MTVLHKHTRMLLEHNWLAHTPQSQAYAAAEPAQQNTHGQVPAGVVPTAGKQLGSHTVDEVLTSGPMMCNIPRPC